MQPALPKRTSTVLRHIIPSVFRIIEDSSKDGDVVKTDPPRLLDGKTTHDSETNVSM